MRTSQPGRNLSFTRAKPAATAAAICARNSSIESIRSKVGPTSIATSASFPAESFGGADDFAAGR